MIQRAVNFFLGRSIVKYRRLSSILLSRRAVAISFYGFLASLISKKSSGIARPIAADFRFHDHGHFTRIVLEITESIGFSIFQLAAPNRIVVDLPEIDWELPSKLGLNQSGVLHRMRYGLFKPGQSRLVIDLSKPAGVMTAFILESSDGKYWRVVIDLVHQEQALFSDKVGTSNRLIVNRLSSPDIENLNEVRGSKIQKVPAQGNNIEKLQTAIPQPKPSDKVQEKKKKLPVIAIDAGHGGIDPGAIGISGVKEKDITLAVARQLRKHLLKTGQYKVVMTRSRDVSLGLRQRIAIARRASADIFVSLHADSIHKKNIKGLSVYTLSENASDKEAEKLAEKENKADLLIGMDLSHESRDVQNILIDLAQRESMNLAALLAEKLISQLKVQVTLLRNTHRFAGFAVLKAPDVPSVLLEMGYLSNRQEERLLRQFSYREKLVVAIGRSLDGYFSEVSV